MVLDLAAKPKCCGAVVLWWCCGGVVVLWCCGGAVVVLWWCCGAVVLWWCCGGVVVVLWCCGGVVVLCAFVHNKFKHKLRFHFVYTKGYILIVCMCQTWVWRSIYK